MPIPPFSKNQFSGNWKNKYSKSSQIKTALFSFFNRLKKLIPNMPQKSFSIKKLIFRAFLAILFLIIAGSVFLAGAFLYYSRQVPDPSKITERAQPESTKIYDRTGKTIIYEVHGNKKRTLVNLEDIANYAKWATITSEDKEFYSHQGFDLRGIARAIFVDFLQGGKVQGGSTITQQLVKNIILTKEKTFTRKIKELLLAYKIEQKFSKDEILKMYFNEVSYGSVIYGIEAASETFFGKSAKDLSLAESAVIAVIPRATTYYSPYGNHTEELLQKQKIVLDQMAKDGYIPAKEAEEAKKEKIIFQKKKEDITAPHFVMYIKDLLAQKYGEKIVEEGGLKVYTTLDLYKQKIAEDAIKEKVENNKKYNAYNAALISLDPKTGEILAMVGSKNYNGDSEPAGCHPGLDCKFEPNVNVTLRPRQPGSSFKPIVYAAAFLRGYTPETMLYDVETVFKTDFADKDYIPHNYNGKEYGPVSVRQALAGSLNIPAVKTIYLTGVNNVLNLADQMGYTTLKDRSRFGLSLVLGGGEIKLLEHANAFAIFAREGEKHELVAIQKVIDKNGQVLEEHQNKTENVFDPEIARQINSILSDNAARSFIFGEKNYLTLADRPVAAKTGTTNDNRDAWIIGYTPSLITGIWVGNNDNSEMKKGADGSVVAAPIWNTFMNRVLKGTPVEQFNPPLPLTVEKPILRGLTTGEVTVKVDRASGKLATNLTPPSFVTEKIYRQLHDILFYVDKDNPQGPAPTRPEDDPQYAGWEEGVRKWAAKQNVTEDLAPTEYDDLHTLENQPTISITSPGNNTTLTSSNLSIQVAASAPRGVNRVEYFLDDQSIGIARQAPFDLSYFINGFGNGFHALKAVAYDDIDNSKSASININLVLP
jgi:1A family penicillin-binding protein